MSMLDCPHCGDTHHVNDFCATGPMAHPQTASEKKAELYDHMRLVAEANGFKSLTEAIARDTAAEARADRLAKALENLEAERKREGVNLSHLKRAVAVAYADMNRAALQQEG